MIRCSKECVPQCYNCIYAIHEEIEDEVSGSTLYGDPIWCEAWKDKHHAEICKTNSSCDDFHCVNALPDTQIIEFEKPEENKRAKRRRSDWRHAIKKKNKSYYYCKDYPWYQDLHRYSKNKIHCSYPSCASKTKGKSVKKMPGPAENWSIKDEKRIEDMKEQVKEI